MANVSDIIVRGEQIQRERAEQDHREFVARSEREAALQRRANWVSYDPSSLGYRRAHRLDDLLPGKAVEFVTEPIVDGLRRGKVATVEIRVRSWYLREAPKLDVHSGGGRYAEPRFWIWIIFEHAGATNPNGWAESWCAEDIRNGMVGCFWIPIETRST